ncbi:hypothetical protein HDU98_010495 [Podochytrium sp. JEL0797]|nr:hypothetical protein HDU98_010495 [Podochytrium sp. JEL0797]
MHGHSRVYCRPFDSAQDSDSESELEDPHHRPVRQQAPFVNLGVSVANGSSLVRGENVLITIDLINTTGQRILFKDVVLVARRGAKTAKIALMKHRNNTLLQQPKIDWTSGTFMRQNLQLTELIAVPDWISPSSNQLSSSAASDEETLACSNTDSLGSEFKLAFQRTPGGVELSTWNNSHSSASLSSLGSAGQAEEDDDDVFSLTPAIEAAQREMRLNDSTGVNMFDSNVYLPPARKKRSLTILKQLASIMANPPNVRKVVQLEDTSVTSFDFSPATSSMTVHPSAIRQPQQPHQPHQPRQQKQEQQQLKQQSSNAKALSKLEAFLKSIPPPSTPPPSELYQHHRKSMTQVSNSRNRSFETDPKSMSLSRSVAAKSMKRHSTSSASILSTSSKRLSFLSTGAGGWLAEEGADVRYSILVRVKMQSGMDSKMKSMGGKSVSVEVPVVVE